MSEFEKIPLLSEAADVLEAQRSRCSWRNFEPNEYILDYGDETTDVMFIVSGKARVLVLSASGRKVILNEMGPGECVGELSALDGRERSASVQALEPTRVCFMPAPLFVDVVTTTPPIALRCMQLITARFRDLSDRMVEHAFLTARQRLCAELLRLSRPRWNKPDQRVISPPPRQEDIADRIASRREVISRELSALAREGLVEKTRGGLVLLNLTELHAKVAEGGRTPADPFGE